MKRTALLSALFVVFAAGSARSLMVAPSPLPERLAHADCVVIGKITEIEKKTIKAVPYPGGKELAEYHVAVIKVDEALVGAKGLTHVRVGFIAPVAPQPVPNQPNRPIAPIAPRRNFGPNLTVGLDACFLLDPHHDQTFHIVSGFQGVIAKGKDATEFNKQMAELRRCAKLLEKPMDGLKSKDANDRFTTAAMLMSRYSTPAPYSRDNKRETIDAEESKLILLAIRDGNWNERRFDQLNPMMTFNRLGAGPKEGWKPPKDFKQFPTDAKDWLTKNADSFRIQRFVAEKK
ncbi:MAG: hypothetical protein AB7K24_24825 [Gemmataceae bacterium]